MPAARDLTSGEVSELLRIARGTARKYGRILPGVALAQVEDAAGDAVVEVLRELHRWDPTRGALGQWAGTVVARVVRRSLRMQRLPVSGSQWTAHQWGVSMAAVCLDDLDHETAPVEPVGPKLAHELHESLSRLVAHIPHGEVGLDALLDGGPPGRLASERGLPLSTVTRARATVRQALEDSAELGALWKEHAHDDED